MNVYDFDGTIYKGDSSRDFFFYCLRKDLKLLRFFPTQFAGFLLYGLKIISKTSMKERFFSFLKGIDDIKITVEQFWDSHAKNIFPYYLNQIMDNDVVVSASPEFLLNPICERLGISEPIATKVDMKTGKFLSLNCSEHEKPKRFLNIYTDAAVSNFYSDSRCDLPMARIAAAAYLISSSGKITPWIIK